MKIFHNVSPQQISWVKSNKDRLEKNTSIANLYYPETTSELLDLLHNFRNSNQVFDIIGHSSNTLFLPSYKCDNLICTKELKSWHETDETIVCDCGVNVANLSKQMVAKGYVGFEGLTDLPGTIAAGVYGNCGCRGCSVNGLVQSFQLLLPDGSIKDLGVNDLKLTYRSTSLKRGELTGVIITVTLKKVQGDAAELHKLMEENHQIRLSQQPSGANNLGTTFNGGGKLTIKGWLYRFMEKVVSRVYSNKDRRFTYPKVLKIMGKDKYVPYVYYWNRYMFLDETAHDFFYEYANFVKSLYKDARLEIEIKK